MQHAQRLYRHVYLTCREESSGRGHYHALVTLLAVLGVELANDEVLVDLIRLVLALQVHGAASQCDNDVLLMVTLEMQLACDVCDWLIRSWPCPIRKVCQPLTAVGFTLSAPPSSTCCPNWALLQNSSSTSHR